VRALRNAVGAESIVLDIGAGPGIFSLLACQFGARHVHAVEPDDSILLGRTLAADNGCSERITFHQQLSSQVTLPKKADVIVSDLRGILPLFQHHIPAIIDARERLLAVDGILIPSRDVIHAAVVEAPELYARYREPWLANDLRLDLSAGHLLVVNGWRKARIKPEHLLTSPHVWAILDYRTIEDPNVSSELTWTAPRAGTAHGLGIWFDADLGGGVGFSNAPGEPELVYGQAFFPFEAEVKLEAGDRISVTLAANLVGADYIFSWSTLIASNVGHVKARFAQSTFLGEVLPLAKLKRTDASFVPTSGTEEMEMDRQCLMLADGVRCLGDIAQSLSQMFPRRFEASQDALAYVAGVFEKYGPHHS
jgi:protein arginine N-methyltransferase 1